MRQLIRFGIAGSVGFVADAAVLYALMSLGLGAYKARVLSFLFAAFVTWRINRRFTFAGDRSVSVWREWGRYLLAMSLGGACNYGAYVVMLGLLHEHVWSPMLALAIGSILGMFVNFLSAKFWVFSSASGKPLAGSAGSLALDRAQDPGSTIHRLQPNQNAGAMPSTSDAGAIVVELGSWLSARKLSWIYLCAAVPSCLFLAFVTPPLQTPDAVNHFFRAYQVAKGGVIGERVEGSSGGLLDTGLIAFGEFESPLKFHKDVKWLPDMNSRAAAVRLTQEDVVAEFPNTAPYPVWNYLPQALPLMLFAHGHALLLPLYRAACLSNVLVALILTWSAIRIAQRARILVFFVALLPMTLSLNASVSQDGNLIPLSFVLLALLDRAIASRAPTTFRQMSGLAVLMVLIATARLPYIGFVLFLFHPSLCLDRCANQYSSLLKRLKWALMTIFAATVLFVIHNRLAGGVTPPGSSLTGQAHYLLTHVEAIPGLVRDTLLTHGAFYAASFIGVLGWLDTYYPKGYYVIAAVVLLVALVSGVLFREPADAAPSKSAAFSVLPLIVSVLLIFAGLYVFWSPVGGSTVEGVQGRYFLPVAPLLGMAFVSRIGGHLAHTRLWENMRAAAAIVIVVFPVFGFFELVAVILKRYYFA